jgi:O-succinylbenzoic acid--CoA ligase
MESEAKSGVFRYQSSWSIAQTMEYLASALRAGDDISITTSGSSGKPKEIFIPASAILFNAQNSNKFLGAKPGEKWSLLLSPEHTAGLNVLVRAMELGTEPVTQNEKADYTAIVPTQLFRALNGDENLLAHLKGCKAVLVGGATSDEELLNRARENGINCITTYGMTETSGGCVYNGTPLPGVEIKIGDTIQIKGAMLAKVPLENGYFVTKDLGFMKDGKLFVTGRSDDVIISGGKNISLSAVENLLGFEFAAMGRANKEWGTALIIVTSSDTDVQEIQSQLSERFGIKALEVIRVPEIPRTALQKVDRAAIAKLLS